MSARLSSEDALRQFRDRRQKQKAGKRTEELVWLVAGSIVIAGALALTGAAMSHEFAAIALSLKSRQVLDLNAVRQPDELVPYLGELPTEAERQFTAARIFAALQRGKFSNVGALGKLRLSAGDIQGHGGLDSIRPRMAAEELRRAEREKERLAQRTWLGRMLDAVRTRGERPVSVTLITPRELRNLKPFFVVRTPAQARGGFYLWCGAFFLAFLAVHGWWRWKGFTGDPLILPLILLMTGIGMSLMISLRDPLRDNLLFTDFGLGVVLGCAAMALFSGIPYDLSLRRFRFIFLAGAVVLGLALFFFGSGPGESDAKVNLLFFQPVEVIRLLIVLFLAGYFAENWGMLRDLRQKHGWLAQKLKMPRLDYVIPIAAGVAVSILLFFLLKDNGPALVIGCAFLTLYAIARKRAKGALAGFAALVLVFAIGHLIRFPRTVADRVDMWWSPWRNYVSGGDQLAHSLWSFAGGAYAGTGLGLGSASSVPAGYTDLILSVAGEQLGFAGLVCIFVLYGLLIWRTLRIALRAPSAYSFFLVMGLMLITALQLMLIAGGILGLIPLSGVVSPFLSYGKTSMVANFIAFAMILAVSSTISRNDPPQKRNFGKPVAWTGALLALCGVAILAKAAYVQLYAPDAIVIRDAEVRFADGSLGLAYNPRISEVLRLIPKGNIMDRNGLPLASSHWDIIAKHQAQYRQLGIALEEHPDEARYYPLGPEFFYLVGDVRSGLRAGARNTAFQEQKSRARLQGFDDRREVVALHDAKADVTYQVLRIDYSDLLPLLRHRYEPANPSVAALLARDRDVTMSIDARLQLRVSRILQKHVEKTGNNGAIVVLDPATGDLLAAASYPWPKDYQFAAFRANPDRSMELELQDRARFGLYPPGSSFKIVTATAALRLDPANANVTYECKPLGGGRVGNFVGSGKRPIRDDEMDHVAHGTVDMAKGIAISCNAYFAQLGYHRVGAKALFETAGLFGIKVARPNTEERLREYLPQASYGQGEVVATPFQMARVAATVANGGKMPQGRWVIDASNPRADPPTEILDAPQSAILAGYMRAVVTNGTGKVLAGAVSPIAGKTGTAELEHKPSHAWFIGFAPYSAAPGGGKKIAFAVLVENGRYGGRTAAPIAGEVVAAAKELGLL